MRLICETGGVAVLAHPWALKNPVAIIRRLKEAGLHGLEVYRSDGKLAGSHAIFPYRIFFFGTSATFLFLEASKLKLFFVQVWKSYLKKRGKLHENVAAKYVAQNRNQNIVHCI